MPHCIVEYAKKLEQTLGVNELLGLVHQAAVESELFEEPSIKTRAIAYDHCLTGGKEQPFIHITVKILFGRNHQQKKDLSRLMLSKIKDLANESMSVSVEVVDIDKTSYSRTLI